MSDELKLNLAKDVLRNLGRNPDPDTYSTDQFEAVLSMLDPVEDAHLEDLATWLDKDKAKTDTVEKIRIGESKKGGIDNNSDLSDDEKKALDEFLVSIDKLKPRAAIPTIAADDPKLLATQAFLKATGRDSTQATYPTDKFYAAVQTLTPVTAAHLKDLTSWLNQNPSTTVDKIRDVIGNNRQLSADEKKAFTQFLGAMNDLKPKVDAPTNQPGSTGGFGTAPSSTELSITLTDPKHPGVTLQIGFGEANQGGGVGGRVYETDETLEPNSKVTKSRVIVPTDSEATPDISKNGHDALVKLLTLTEDQRTKLFEELSGANGKTVLKNLLKDGKLPQSVSDCSADDNTKPDTGTDKPDTKSGKGSGSDGGSDGDDDGAPHHLPPHAPGAEKAADSRVETDVGPIGGKNVYEGYFDWDSDNLTQKGAEALWNNAQVMLANPNVKFRIDVHCDTTGTDEYNMDLGEDRIDSIKEYLVNQCHVPESQLEFVNHGKAEPHEDGGGDQLMDARNRGFTTTPLSPIAPAATITPPASAPLVTGGGTEGYGPAVLIVGGAGGYSLFHDREHHRFMYTRNDRPNDCREVTPEFRQAFEGRGMTLHDEDGTITRGGRVLDVNGGDTGRFRVANATDPRMIPFVAHRTPPPPTPGVAAPAEQHPFVHAAPAGTFPQRGGGGGGGQGWGHGGGGGGWGHGGGHPGRGH